MKHLQLYENWVKKYGEKISQEAFKALEIGQQVKYIGTSYKIVKTGDVLVLKDEAGKEVKVNYNMFNQKGAIIVDNKEVDDAIAEIKHDMQKLREMKTQNKSLQKSAFTLLKKFTAELEKLEATGKK